jgi:hypothetical protein
MYKTIFLKESEENIFSSLKSQGIKTKVFEHRLGELFNKVYNNEVGYYLFKQGDIVYKMIVLPKTIDISDEDAEKKFVNYLIQYYKINNQYNYDKEKKIPDSLLQQVYESNNAKHRTHDILDEFQSLRYEATIKSIEKFFKRHKNYKKIEIDYISQSIKHKLNLKKNIKELDKTKIHQSQNKDVIFSILATITLNALKLFLMYRVDTIDEKYRKKVISQTNKLINILSKKFNIEKGYKLTIASLQGIKVEKIFSKTKENRQLLVDIKSLFGFEQMYKDKALKVDSKNDLMTTSLFIKPDLFYEWYVYDILKKYADDNDKIIEFDKKETTATEYLLNTEKKSSNPDYILTDKANMVKVVIDAKWKNINKSGDIKSSDYLKLKFDTSLIKSKGNIVSSYLIYPKVDVDEKSFSISVDKKEIFEFNIVEIDMDFDGDFDFKFDTQEIEESIKENIEIEKLKTVSSKLSKSIDTQRASAISKLINEDDSDKKEEIRADLDKQFIQSAIELSENIKEQTILPEIEEILNNYDDILEEESKKFLKSSSVIYSYYKDKSYEHFDYSMPGSGFWKLIELELNTSFVWHIRVKNNVCNKDCPWTPIGSSKRAIFYEIDSRKKVRLNQFEHNNNAKLQGIMLGGINLLLNEQDILDEFDPINQTFLKNNLSKVLKNIISLRNEHAHIKAMSLKDFEKLWELLLSGEKNFIKKLLDFKKDLTRTKFILF